MIFYLNIIKLQFYLIKKNKNKIYINFNEGK